MIYIKKITAKILVLVFLLVVSFSCSDSLDLKPPATWTPDNFYKNESEVNFALAGIYGQLRGYNALGENLLMMDYGTDEGYATKGFTESYPVNIYNHNSTTAEVIDSWQMLYAAINNANNFIRNIKPETFEDVDDYNRYIGEAKFLRGFIYFLLTSWWNEVPLRLEPTLDTSSNHVAPASVEEIYLQIIDDLTFAAENLPDAFDDSYEIGHANKMAAHALIAKTYLKAAGYPAQLIELNGKDPYVAAKAHCLTIIESEHDLNPSYRDLFLNYIQNKYDLKESIFELVFSNGVDLGINLSGRLGNFNGLLYKPSPRTETPYGDPEISPSPLFNTLYQDELNLDLVTDIRKNWNVPQISLNANTGNIIAQTSALTSGYGVGKFRRWDLEIQDETLSYAENIAASNVDSPGFIVLEEASPLNAVSTSINLPVVRYADVLLLYAEAENELNGPTSDAFVQLNKVRRRAGLLDVDVSSAGFANKDDFRDQIMKERLLELCFEGHRKFDLIRWGVLKKKLVDLKDAILEHPSYDSSKHETKLRCVRNFDETKHLSLPYPQQEVTINNLLEQKPEW